MPTTHIFYQWKERVQDESGVEQLVTPWADPWLYEYAYDFMFSTPEEARAGLKDSGVDPSESKDWVLMKITEEPVTENHPPEQDMADRFDDWMDECPVDYQITGSEMDEGEVSVFFSWDTSDDEEE